MNIYWLIAAIVAQLITYLLNALTYQGLIKGYGIHPYPRLLELYKVSVISLFFNQTVPSAGISGNTFIFNFLRKKKINSSQIISVILLDLLIFYLSTIIYLVFFLVTKLFFYKLPAVFGGLLIGGIIVYLVFGGLILLFAKKSSLDFLIRRFKKIKLIRKYAERFERLQPAIGTGEKIALMSFVSGHKKIVAKNFIVAASCCSVRRNYNSFFVLRPWYPGFSVYYTTCSYLYKGHFNSSFFTGLSNIV